MSEENQTPQTSGFEAPKAAAPQVKYGGAASARPIHFDAPVVEEKTPATLVLLDAVCAVVAISFAVLVYLDNGIKLF